MRTSVKLNRFTFDAGPELHAARGGRVEVVEEEGGKVNRS